MASNTLETWEAKAHQLIGEYCWRAYEAANPPGKRRKRHKPYNVPDIAAALVSALGIRDEAQREQEIKRLFEVERLGAWTLI